MNEHHNPSDVGMQFEAALTDRSSELRFAFSAYVKERQPIPNEDILRISRHVRNKCTWLAEALTRAFLSAEKEGTFNDVAIPKVIFQKMDLEMPGAFEPMSGFILLNLQYLLEYLFMTFAPENPSTMKEIIQREVRIRFVIFAETRHYFQIADPENEQLFREYSKGWQDLTLEEQDKAYLTHPLERESKLFAAQQLIAELNEEIELLKRTSNEKEIRRKSYLAGECIKLIEYVKWISSQ